MALAVRLQSIAATNGYSLNNVPDNWRAYPLSVSPFPQIPSTRHLIIPVRPIKSKAMGMTVGCGSLQGLVPSLEVMMLLISWRLTCHGFVNSLLV
jgi:hypothetical protein